MVLSQEQYEDLSRRVQAGEFLQQDGQSTVPSLPDNATEIQTFREQCQQTLELYQLKIKALQAQLEALRKEQESDKAAREADASVADFNKKLEEKYLKQQEKSAEELRNAKKALEDLQALSDSVLEENKRLKEEGSTRQPVPTTTDPQAGVKEIVDFCIEFVSNIDEVTDKNVEVIRHMIQTLILSPLAKTIPAAAQLDLMKRLNDIEKTRRQQASQRKEKERQEERPIVQLQHNTNCSQFYGQADNATINHNEKPE